jgi:triphosphoribosyl-dephospho-CoA synthase
MAPLARAALVSDAPLRDSVREVLGATTIDDARWSYQAIRLAGAGGMGAAAEQDLAGEPSVTLLDAMRLASGRDSVAHEYAGGYDITFGHTLPMLRRARSDRLEWPDAVVESYLALLAIRPDTLVARKLGATVAAEVSEQAAGVVRAGGVRTRRGLEAIKAFDARLSDEHNSRNPGTTADLIAAGILALLLEDGPN